MYETATTKVLRLRQDAVRKARGFLAATVVAAAFVVPPLVAGFVAPAAHASTTFTVTNTDDSGSGSLRQAILDANNTTGADAITFAIQDASRDPVTGVATIKPQSDLPTITERVTINGYSQQDASPNTKALGDNASIKVELDGTNSGAILGLSLDNVSNSVIRGLAIHNFFMGIDITGDSVGNRIEGNFIGADATGTLTFGNNVHGVHIHDGPTQTVVGGTTPEKRNLIVWSGLGAGVALSNTDGNRIQGNYLGTDRGGNASEFGGNDTGVNILGGSDNNTVGGTQAGAGNLIAASHHNGVTTQDSSAGNRVYSNSLSFNDGLGMDLIGADENSATSVPTPNDPKDADTGANHLQNKPILSSARNADGKTTVRGGLHTRPIAGLSYTIQFFSNPSGQNEGQKLVGQKVVKTDGSGDAPITFIPSSKVAAGRTITATATRNSNGDTSEFSAPRTVTSS